MGRSEMFGLYPVRSRIVLVDTLMTRNAWINLTYLDLEDHLGQNQAAQKGSFLIEGSPSEIGRGELPEARCPLAAGGFGPMEEVSVAHHIPFDFMVICGVGFSQKSIASLSIIPFFSALLLKQNSCVLYSEVR